MVVDSPPGITRPSSAASSSARRTSTASTPSSRSARTCSRNAPWSARTPTLPATRLEQPVLAEGGDLDADHGLAEPGRHLRQDLRIVVVRRRLDDCRGALGRVAALEDARA